MAREAIGPGIVERISNVSVWRGLHQDAIKPLSHRSWMFPGNSLFAERAGPILDLYAEYQRMGALCYLAAWDARRARISTTARPRAASSRSTRWSTR